MTTGPLSDFAGTEVCLCIIQLSWNEEEGPSLASALRDQLGLQIRAEKVPVARFVLDSAQKPTPN